VEDRKLTPEELTAIKEQLLESIYTDIGRSVVKKILWVVGALATALFIGLKAAGKI
jgi:hypothetical protein